MAILDLAGRIPYLAIDDRPELSWPRDAGVAIWVVPNVEHYEYIPPPNGSSSHVPYPDTASYALRDFGNRVGFWRMLDVLDEHAVRATVSLNVSVLGHYPEIRDVIRERNWSVMSHGFYNTRFLYGMSVDEERKFYTDVAAIVSESTGQTLKGALGPGLSFTSNTCDLMAECGMTYLADFVLDDQPVPVVTGSGRLVALPYSYELNDLTQISRGGDYLERAWRAQFDCLWRESENRATVMCLPIHPFVIGQAHMIDHLSRTLDHILGHDGVWLATGDEIAAHYIEHSYDSYLDRARERHTRIERVAP